MVSSSKEIAPPPPPPPSPHSPPPQPPLGVRFVSAGLAACVADLVTFPLDTAKVRLQIQGEVSPRGHDPRVGVLSLVSRNDFKYRGMISTVHVITREEGVRALYNGLAAGLQRQLCFASIRIGLYDTVKQTYIGIFNASDVSGSNVGLRILAAITTGAVAVSVAQPTDVVKVRMQAQTKTKNNARYKGCLDAYTTIGTQEGIRGLWRGVLPNIARNAIVNAAELVSYDLVKEWLLRRRLMSDRMPCHFVSAFGAGFCTTVVASPVDVVKTRYMNSAPGVYRGAVHCAVVTYREGGFAAFYKGFTPSFLRISSWNIVMFVTYEQLKRHVHRFTSSWGQPSDHLLASPVTHRSSSSSSSSFSAFSADVRVSEDVKSVERNQPKTNE